MSGNKNVFSEIREMSVENPIKMKMSEKRRAAGENPCCTKIANANH